MGIVCIVITDPTGKEKHLPGPLMGVVSCARSQNHKIIHVGEKTQRLSGPTFNLVQASPPLNYVPKLYIYMFFLKTTRGGDSTTSLGSLFQCCMSLSVSKFLIISNLDLSWCNLKPFPIVLLLGTWIKCLILTSLQPPLR